MIRKQNGEIAGDRMDEVEKTGVKEGHGEESREGQVTSTCEGVRKSIAISHSFMGMFLSVVFGRLIHTHAFCQETDCLEGLRWPYSRIQHLAPAVS